MNIGIFGLCFGILCALVSAVGISGSEPKTTANYDYCKLYEAEMPREF